MLCFVAGPCGHLPRRLAQKDAFALLLPVAALSTNPLDIASLSQIFPEIIEL